MRCFYSVYLIFYSLNFYQTSLKTCGIKSSFMGPNMFITVLTTWAVGFFKWPTSVILFCSHKNVLVHAISKKIHRVIKFELWTSISSSRVISSPMKSEKLAQFLNKDNIQLSFSCYNFFNNHYISWFKGAIKSAWWVPD